MTIFVTSSIAILHVICNLSIIVFYAFLSNILIIDNPDISSSNGVSTFSNFWFFGFKTICPLGKKGSDLFRKVKHDHVFIIPSNSNIFFIPITKSMFHVFPILMCIFRIYGYVYLSLLV